MKTLLRSTATGEYLLQSESGSKKAISENEAKTLIKESPDTRGELKFEDGFSSLQILTIDEFEKQTVQ